MYSQQLRESFVYSIKGLFSASVAELLIQDGILGSTVGCFRSGHTGYFDLSKVFHVRSVQSGPFWYPDFITKGEWELAADKFESSLSLEWCIQQKLLPRLKNPDAVFGYVDRLIPLEQQLINMGILETPIRIVNENVYFFDADHIYQQDSLQRFYREPPKVWHLDHINSIQKSIWERAVAQFQPGATLTECLDIFKTIRPEPLVLQKEYTPFERLVQRIERPTFERTPENKDPKTVDRIRILVDLPRYMFPNRSAILTVVRENKTLIDRMVVERITGSAQFQKFGIPFNFFRISECTFRQDYTLEYLFELKL